MSGVATGPRTPEVSPRTKARMAGGFYLATILTGVFTQGFVSQLIVSGDAAATAANILSHEAMFRLGFAVYLVELACQITMTALMYDVLKPVSRSGSLLAATFGLTGCAVKILSRLFFFAPLLVLGEAHYLSVFSTEQLHALALLSLGVTYHAEAIAMVFFGFSALLKGYLVFRSSFLPRILGVFSAAGGLGWLTYLYEPLASRMAGYIVSFAVIAGFSTALWLLVFTVNEQRWRQQAQAAGAMKAPTNQRGEYPMKHNLMLRVASLFTVLPADVSPGGRHRPRVRKGRGFKSHRGTHLRRLAVCNAVPRRTAIGIYHHPPLVAARVGRPGHPYDGQGCRPREQSRQFQRRVLLRLDADRDRGDTSLFSVILSARGLWSLKWGRSGELRLK